MNIATLVLSLLLAALLLGSGVMKLLHAPNVVGMMEAVHVTRPQMTVLGMLEIAATIGLVGGIWVPPLAIAAAVGTILYFAGAIVAHLRAHDRAMQGAAAFLAIAAATLALQLVTL